MPIEWAGLSPELLPAIIGNKIAFGASGFGEFLDQVKAGEVKVLAVTSDERIDALPDVPTLVFGGTLDPVTPHSGSEGQAAAMPNAQFVSVPRGGHGVAGFDACTSGIVLAFLDDPGSPTSDCAGTIAPLAFGTE